MEVLKGRTAFPGIAIGRIRFLKKKRSQSNNYRVLNIDNELRDFARISQQLRDGYAKSLQEGEETLPDGQREALLRKIALLDAESLKKAVSSMIRTQKVPLSHAIQITCEEMNRSFDMLDSQVVQNRIRDMGEISREFLRILGQSTTRIHLGDTPVILAASALTPSDILEMDKKKLLSLVTREGSEISHAAILAKTIDIPALFDIEVSEHWEGQMAIVDGYTSTMYLNPSEEFLKEYRFRQAEQKEEREELLKLKDMEDVTLDGKKVELCANIGVPEDITSVRYYGASGIGLFRSEYQYLSRESLPEEEELFRDYRMMAEAMDGKPVVIRTVDLGADKRADYLEIREEQNPLMGNRGIRYCLDNRELFVTQLRAVYRAAAYGRVSVLYPMLVSLEELDEIDALTREVRESLARENIRCGEVRRGIMIETPAAALITEEFAARVDFLSIGTNDLTQYVLAMDRQNPQLKKKYNDRHPAVMKLVEMIVRAAHAQNKKVCLCGEIAADTDLTEMFLRMGIDAFSVVPACVLPLRKEIRGTDLGR